MQFPKQRNPYPTTDIVIEYSQNGREGIVLIERKNFPHGIALPGGFYEWGLTPEENAIKEAKEETGLDIMIEDPLHPLCVRGSPTRDPRGHMLSLAYIAQGRGILRAGDDAKAAKLYSIPEVLRIIDERRLVFDHEEIVKEYLRKRGYL